MLRGVTSSGKRKKASQRVRRKKQAQAASNRYVEDTKVEACSWEPTLSGAKPVRVVCHLVRGKRIWKSDSSGVANLQPKAKVERDDDMDEPQASGTTPGIHGAAKLECKGESDGDEGEDADIDEEDNDDHDDGMIEQLSRRMSKFLRHTAHKEGLLWEEDWLPLSDLLPRLQCNEAEVAIAVRLSDRGDDHCGCGPRFQMCFSSSMTWIRATDGEYYRHRASARAIMSQ